MDSLRELGTPDLHPSRLVEPLGAVEAVDQSGLDKRRSLLLERPHLRAWANLLSRI